MISIQAEKPSFRESKVALDVLGQLGSGLEGSSQESRVAALESVHFEAHEVVRRDVVTHPYLSISRRTWREKVVLCDTDSTQ